MGVSIQLQNGSNVIIYETPQGGAAFDELSASLAPITLADQVAGQASAVSGQALANGGFSVEWDAGGVLMARDYDASGQPADPAHLWHDLQLSAAPAGFASNAGGASTWLANGDQVVSSQTSDGASNYQVHVQLYSPEGAPVGPAFAATAPPVSLFTAPVVASLADGSYEAAWVQQGNYSSHLTVEHFTTQGTAAGQTDLAVYGGFSAIGASGYALAGLANGDFAAAWTVQDALNGGPAQVWAEEFTASGAAVGSATLVGTAASPNPAPVIDAEANGAWVVSWTSPSGADHHAFGDPAPAASSSSTSTSSLMQIGADIAGAVSGALSGALSGAASGSVSGGLSGVPSSGPAWESALSSLHPFASGASSFAEAGHLLAGLHAAHAPSFGFF
jgi:hypothetical protein